MLNNEVEFEIEIEQTTTEEEILELRRDRFEQKRENRAEAYERLANKHKKLSAERYNQASKISDMIPFGQPILVGHHSERRHRRDAEKINSNMRKSVEHQKTADYYAGRLAAMESNDAISSDDPDAIAKLEAKLILKQDYQEFMKSANKIIRSKKLSEEQKFAKLGEMGIRQSTARLFMTPDFAKRVGFVDYQLQNNNAIIRQVKARIEELKAKLANACLAPIEEEEYPQLELKLVRNREINRLQLVFPRKPSNDVRSLLGKWGFKFSYEQVAWQRLLNANAEFSAKCVIDALMKGI